MMKPLPASHLTRWRPLLGWSLAADAPVRELQQRLLLERTHAIALAFAALALLWVPLDLWLLGAGGWKPVLALRLVLAAALFVLALAVRPERARLSAGRGLGLLVLAQCAAFAAMNAVLGAEPPPLLLRAYGFFPFVMVAQLALFPLPALRVGALALPAFAIVLLPRWAPGADMLAVLLLADLWLLTLILALVAWAAAAQLDLLHRLLRARHSADHDALTGLANRRKALARLGDELARAHRYDEPLALLMLDLDHFKQVNDRHGHATGDEVLRTTGEVLQQTLREVDLAARWGGEEFIVLLPSTPLANAREAAERVRAALAQAAIPLASGASLQFSASIGLAMRRDGDNEEALVARADAALYEAKRQGRNRIVAESPGA